MSASLPWRENRIAEPIPATGSCNGRCSSARAAAVESHVPRTARPDEGSGVRAPNLTGEMAVTLFDSRPGGPIIAHRRRRKLMEKFVIEGGVPLSGTMIPAGNKNGALPILAASVLTEDEVLVRNVPRIRDVDAMLEILRAIGVDVSWRGPNEVALCAAGELAVDPDLAYARGAERDLVGAAP